jgi:hypothetical protein
MGAGVNPIKVSSLCHSCQLLVRQHDGPMDFFRFLQEGLEVGQQVVALAGATCLTNLSRALNASGFQTQNLLRSGRLVFLTAPDCIEQLKKPDGPVQRAALRRQSPMVRWISDWSWAYSSDRPANLLIEYQQRIHGLVRSLEALSLCTVDSSSLPRRALLALLADHRRAVRGPSVSSTHPQFSAAATAGTFSDQLN